ncbi:uncharacterized protein DNG_07134 [Cephalotrichum gorgonifer]|uniref:histone acetyltransferase n=1 Tax=Cephalotrichum gorgonifer TaxID=2041049 RepID=A0AAE8N2V5_9PEZI|nr:uncharacterized protein DNG_07134 [Cephalotrichum gorgonifer]
MPPAKRKRQNNDTEDGTQAPVITRRATRHTPNPGPPAPDPPGKDPATASDAPNTRRGRQAASSMKAPAAPTATKQTKAKDTTAPAKMETKAKTRAKAKDMAAPANSGAANTPGALSGPKYTQTTLKWNVAADAHPKIEQPGTSDVTMAPTEDVKAPRQAPSAKPRPAPKRGAARPAQKSSDKPAPSKTQPPAKKACVPSTTDRNIDKVVLGDICFRTWYPSYYGKDVLGDTSSGGAGAGAGAGTGKHGQPRKADRDACPVLDRLYVCPCCFKYSKELVTWWEHVRVCESRGFVPGRRVYVHPKTSRTVPPAPAETNGKGPKRRRGDGGGVAAVPQAVQDEGEWSVWEVDGAKEGLFCQNLSLFAKLFLDNKSVFFDVTGFNYFLLVFSRPPSSPASEPKHQICGFFSKEKLSWDNNNLACILVFPPWQRKGLGSLLMGASYEISRKEGILGGPEKPISELGRKGYGRFWAGEIARWLLTTGAAGADGGELIVDVGDVSDATWIAPEDCLSVLRDMGVVEDDGMGPKKSAPAPGGDAQGEDGEATDGAGADAAEVPEPELVPRVRIVLDAVRAWVANQRISLEKTCDPDGFEPSFVEELERKAVAVKNCGAD